MSPTLQSEKISVRKDRESSIEIIDEYYKLTLSKCFNFKKRGIHKFWKALGIVVSLKECPREDHTSLGILEKCCK